MLAGRLLLHGSEVSRVGSNPILADRDTHCKDSLTNGVRVRRLRAAHRNHHDGVRVKQASVPRLRPSPPSLSYRELMMSEAQRVTAAALVGISASLLTVGFVSTPPTVWRHVIQIIPVVAAFVLVARGIRSWPFAAMPIFLVWLFLMVMIWLFLLGVKTPFSGTFSPAEVALTIIIAICCLLGLASAARSVIRSGWMLGIAVFAVAAAAQYG